MRCGLIIACLLLPNLAALPHALSEPPSPGSVRAADYKSLAEMESACDRLAVDPCLVTITTHQAFALATPHTTPRNFHLRFAPGGLWDVQGAALTLADGTIDAAEDARIFASDASIRGLKQARPEWFADPAPDGFPPSALAQAYRATVPMGTILLREATYISPFFDPLTPGQCSNPIQSYTSPRIFLGVRRPVVDREQSPQKLQAGTVIRGEICGFAALIALHLGIDEGPYVVDHLFGGHTSYGIYLGHTGPLHTAKGTALTDLSVLTSRMPDQYSVIVEGQDDLTISNLSIWTLGGTHGLGIKAANVNVQDFYCKGASSDCLLVKSDLATANKANASNLLIRNVHIGFLEHPGDTGGIAIDSRWDSVHHLTLDHIAEDQTSYGIYAAGSFFHQLHDISISNWTAEVANHCLQADYSNNVTVERFKCTVLGQPPGASAFEVRGNNTILRDGTIACAPGLPACAGQLIDGIADLGTANTIDRVTGDRLTGYLLRNRAHAQESISNLTTISMGGRFDSLYQPPPESFSARVHRIISIVKPNLRILYTAALTRWRLFWGWFRA